MKTELFENTDVTASICHPSEHALGTLGIMRGHFACLFSFFIDVRMSNIVIEYRISLSNSEFRVSHSFRVDGGTFENAPRVGADLLYTVKKICFQKDSNRCGRGLNVR